MSTLETAINAIVAKKPDAGQKIEMAAMHLAGTAQVLAKGIASSKGISGNVAGAGSSLRAGLTGLLVQHVAATAFVVQTAVAAGGDLSKPEVKGSIAALSDNTNQLGAAFGSIYGPAAQQEFLKLWNAHIGYFVNYTLGVATGESREGGDGQEGPVWLHQSVQRVHRRGDQAAAVAWSRRTCRGTFPPWRPRSAPSSPGAPDASTALMMAENHMAGTGAVLAQGIAASMPAKFAAAS